MEREDSSSTCVSAPASRCDVAQPLDSIAVQFSQPETLQRAQCLRLGPKRPETLPGSVERSCRRTLQHDSRHAGHPGRQSRAAGNQGQAPVTASTPPQIYSCGLLTMAAANGQRARLQHTPAPSPTGNQRRETDGVVKMAKKMASAGPRARPYRHRAARHCLCATLLVRR